MFTFYPEYIFEGSLNNSVCYPYQILCYCIDYKAHHFLNYCCTVCEDSVKHYCFKKCQMIEDIERMLRYN